MELIQHADIRRAISVKIAVAPKYAQRGFGLLERQCRRELLDAIMSVLQGAVIVQPGMVGLCERRGKFGVDEPHPFPELAVVDDEDNAQTTLDL